MTKRLRMIAGPNGSGKTSVIKPVFETFNVKTGIYVNADDIERNCKENRCLNFSNYGITVTAEDFTEFASTHGLIKKYWWIRSVPPISIALNNFMLFFKIKHKVPSFDFKRIKCSDNSLIFPKWFFIHPYFSAILADFIRHKLLETGCDFTFETVMSDADKIGFLKKAKEYGYKTYLYYVTTENEFINIGRVKERVEGNGHNVPVPKIKKRYKKSLEQLYNAILVVDRAFLWDNSRGEKGNELFIAEVEDGDQLHVNNTLKLDQIPRWFYSYVLEKANKRNS